MRAHVRSAVALVVVMLSFGFMPASARADVPATASDTTAPAATKVAVTVIGMVKKPDRYELDAGARLSDALTASGAFAIEPLVARVGGLPVPNSDCAPGGAGMRFVYLVRAAESPSAKPLSYAIDAGRIRAHTDMRYDPVLKQDDKIYVPDCRPPWRPIMVPPTFPTSPSWYA